MLLRSIQAAAAALFLLPVGASAATIQFDSAADCNAHGVSITGAYGEACVTKTFYGENGATGAALERGQYSSFWVATFEFLADYVSIDLGDYGWDADELFLTAHSLGGGETTVKETIGTDFSGLTTLSLSAPDIFGISFGTTGNVGLGGIFADNLTINPQQAVSAVPVPASVLLLGTAFAGLGAMRRSKRT